MTARPRSLRPCHFAVAQDESARIRQRHGARASWALEELRAKYTNPRHTVHIIGFAKAVAQEVASRNITVNVVAPGFVDGVIAQTTPTGRAMPGR